MWKQIIEKEKQKKYFKNILFFLRKQIEQKKQIFPSYHNIFKAFELTPWHNTKVILLGQDPYHGLNQAHGLSFSVANAKTPPSLKNIFKELKQDIGLITMNNDLSVWAQEGVLLLNVILTVNKNEPLSHQNIGWEHFTTNIFKCLNQKKNLVYILWGKFAQSYASYINTKNNYIIKSPHPSPFSAHRGFFGSKPFSRTNKYLIYHNIKPINWNLKK
ncbi:MAG: uracil-DNA glycosylase [Candidatus Phytoplasma stylosanthis]|uniref:uracil-DNA glycosylase n=1 Tax=Candidatus Phytoplasma stylosanthis TaxID=2798314 RepID=UPI00293A3C66|nr:uracil-DNA glycosylase [Candidatus Phytoplasma stylosanthis]MDV3168008.1 uracil-DNA glycosylase [Candidatus Phytoplasma stylosanthis]MDV3171078.1 uracil-DNA glycosylase [Candidatus Phytoplasma stylosanthis]MDV3174260.1 uracil-DNA glycosylase [Candidatus Phytoplasma stylosanthis]MDV3202626.1 uracil-DNA glycosylase [Candidatus Phytoplasma stylosanthis]